MLYRLGRFLYRVLFTLVFRYRVKGRDHVPDTGGVLLVANHASLFDPPLVGSAVKRPVFFMAKGDLFKIPVLGSILPRVKAFPVHRGGADRAAVRRAIELLEAGEVVVLFPEGTRTDTGKLLPFQRGAGLIALRANVPVVPIALLGTYKPFSGPGIMPKKFVVKIGQPIDLTALKVKDSGKLSADDVNALIRKGIERLMKEDTT